MGVNLLYNLGNSDIYVNGRFISKDTDFLSFTKEIWDNIGEFHPEIENRKFSLVSSENSSLTYREENIEKIEFPIFSEFFWGVKNRFKVLPQKIFFFSTMQSPPHQKDTYYTAEIIRYILQNTLFSENKKAIKIEIIDKNPSDYSDMDLYYSEFIEKYRSLLLRTSFNLVHIATGTPAMSFCLSTNLYTLFNVKYFYVAHTQDMDKLKEVKYFKGLNLKNYARIIKTLLDVYEYDGARRIFKDSPLNIADDIDKILEMMIARRELRFEDALKIAIALSGKASDPFSFVADYFSDILDPEKGLRVWASFEEMEIYLDRNEYHIALASYFNVMENLVSYLIFELGEDPENLKKDDGKYYTHPERIEWIKKNAKSKSNAPPFSIIFDREFERLEQKVREKRNKGPLAHGFSGIEEEDKQRVKILYEKLKDTLKPLSHPYFRRENFYKYMNGVIYDYMEKIISDLQAEG